MSEITKRERSHLQALVRQHYRLLRKEVSTEETRALAEADTRIAEHRRAVTAQAHQFHSEADGIMRLANEQIEALIARHDELFGPEGRWRCSNRFYQVRAYRRTDTDEQTLRRALVGQIKAKAAEARTRIEREENEKLRAILIDALESDAAVAINASLPALADVFSVDLRAIEVGEMT